jgi:UDP-N-acetylmuramate dehydrogenase
MISLSQMPSVRGRLTENAPLAPTSWFRVGGSADILFKPADIDDLGQFLTALPDDYSRWRDSRCGY